MTPKEFRRALEERGIERQVDAAAALGVTQASISRWLRGAIPVPALVMVALKGIPKRKKAS